MHTSYITHIVFYILLSIILSYNISELLYTNKILWYIYKYSKL